jgi:asparagine synthase (glutamine-hydrolysing)
MMYLDLVGYLPDDVLAKVDRASMAVGLEVRVPYVDHRLVEFVRRLPVGHSIRGVVGKRPLRRVLRRYVPESLTRRPKMGFGVPMNDWLRGPLRDWAHALLDERRLTADGLLRPEPVRRTWEAHLSGRCNWGDRLWSVLAFQSWLDSRERAQPPETACLDRSQVGHHIPLP